MTKKYGNDFDITNPAPRHVVAKVTNSVLGFTGPFTIHEGFIYHLYRVEVGGFHTDIFLQECPETPFNSVDFEEVVAG